MTNYIENAPQDPSTLQGLLAEHDMTDLNETGELDLPEVVVPSIATSSMRVGLSISIPTMRKLDKKATREVLAHNNAKTGAANVHKKLVSSTLHTELTKLVSAIRTAHRLQTVPWGDLGDRLVANENLIEYKNEMEEFEREFWALAERVIEAYPNDKARAEEALGDMFNPNEYPSVAELRTKFKFSFPIEVVPDIGDWRVDVGNQAVKEARDQYKQVVVERVNKVKQDLADRLKEPLERMSKGLDYVEEADKTGFRNTLVDNILNIVKLIRTCNLGADPALTAIQKQLEATLAGVTPDKLRHSPTLRAKTKSEVDKIISTLPSLGF
jgi:hypothetical protein